MNRLLTSTALLLAIAGAPSAQAQCVTGPSGITCTGTETGGIFDPTDGLLVEIAPGASVTGPFEAIEVSDATIRNAGTVTAPGIAVAGNFGFPADPGDTLTVENSGTIDGGSGVITFGGDLVVTNSGVVGGGISAEDGSADVTNSGRIEGDGVSGGRELGDTVRLVNSGVVDVDGDALTSGFESTDAFGQGAVVVNSGTIEAGGRGVRATGDASITNEATGTIDAAEDGVRVGDRAVILNDGTIAAGDDGVQGGADLLVENAGRIEAADTGIDADDQDGLSVVNSGLIEAVDRAVRAGDGADALLDNTGEIISGDEGFEAGDGAQVFNRAGASITAFEDAVQVGRGALIVNEGLIESTGDDGDGIDVDQGDITNSGTIRTTGAAGIDFDAEGIDDAPVTEDSVILNEAGALIEGIEGIIVDEDNTATQIVLNAGTIRGTGGTALDLGAGDDGLELEPGSVVDGDALFGAGDDTLLYERNVFETVVDDFGVFDGGAGTDRASLFGFLRASASILATGDGAFDVTVLEDGSRLTLTLAGFEEVEFDDAVVTLDTRPPAVIPLPAGLPLLAAGLGALALLRRRR